MSQRQDPGAVPGASTINTLEIKISSCCTRKRTWKDLMFLPMAVGFAVLGLVVLLGIEMGIAYALGYVDPSVFMMGAK